MIIAENIVKSYNGESVLNGINLNVKGGEFVSIVGESGSGKTTLLEVLAGVRIPDSGKVYLDGEDISAKKDGEISKLRRTKIGVVFQNYAMIDTLSAFDNIALPLVLEGEKKEVIKEKVEDVAKKLNVFECFNKYPSQLSGGQQQRVAIARVLVYNPKILFLDEPTGALDSKNTECVLATLKKINEEFKVTILQITHSDRAAAFGSRIVRIADGILK